MQEFASLDRFGTRVLSLTGKICLCLGYFLDIQKIIDSTTETIMLVVIGK